jgi:hypothetical protein
MSRDATVFSHYVLVSIVGSTWLEISLIDRAG